jgi:hypothetical protein
MFVCGFFFAAFCFQNDFSFFHFSRLLFGLLIVPSLFFFRIYFCDTVAFTYYGFMRIIRTIRGALQTSLRMKLT